MQAASPPVRTPTDWMRAPGKRRAPVPAVRALTAQRQALPAGPEVFREHLAERVLAYPAADLGMRVPGVTATLGARLQAGFRPDPAMRRAGDKPFPATVHQRFFPSLSRRAAPGRGIPGIMPPRARAIAPGERLWGLAVIPGHPSSRELPTSLTQPVFLMLWKPAPCS